MVKITWTELAVSDLREIFDFIAKDSEKYASITIGKIYQKVQKLKTSKFTGRVVPEFNNPSIKEVFLSNYRIVYLVKTQNSLEILRIYHSARMLLEKDLE